MFSIALDGPAGAGKSTVAKLIAADLKMHYVDTGAMYRTLAYGLLSEGIDIHDEKAVAAALPGFRTDIRYEDGLQKMFLNGEEVTPFIRTAEVGEGASVTSGYGAVREKLLEMQRELARKYDVVMDGRDIGTVILPDAPLKIYLTADDTERGRRRFLELEEKEPGRYTLEEVIGQIRERDYRDMHRAIAPLTRAKDAVLVDTTAITAKEAAAMVAAVARERGAGRG